MFNQKIKFLKAQNYSQKSVQFENAAFIIVIIIIKIKNLVSYFVFKTCLWDITKNLLNERNCQRQISRLENEMNLNRQLKIAFQSILNFKIKIVIIILDTSLFMHCMYIICTGRLVQGNKIPPQ